MQWEEEESSYRYVNPKLKSKLPSTADEISKKVKELSGATDDTHAQMITSNSGLKDVVRGNDTEDEEDLTDEEKDAILRSKYDLGNSTERAMYKREKHRIDFKTSLESVYETNQPLMRGVIPFPELSSFRLIDVLVKLSAQLEQQNSRA